MKILAKIVGYCFVGALVAGAGWMIFDQWSNTQALKHELASAQKQLTDLAIDHRDTMDALNKAQLAREEIHEKARLQEQKLARLLAKNPLAGELLPDDWRMCLQWDEDGNCEVSTTGEPASGDPDSGTEQGQDSGRHGADHR